VPWTDNFNYDAAPTADSRIIVSIPLSADREASPTHLGYATGPPGATRSTRATGNAATATSGRHKSIAHSQSHSGTIKSSTFRDAGTGRDAGVLSLRRSGPLVVDSAVSDSYRRAMSLPGHASGVPQGHNESTGHGSRESVIRNKPPAVSVTSGSDAKNPGPTSNHASVDKRRRAQRHGANNRSGSTGTSRGANSSSAARYVTAPGVHYSDTSSDDSDAPPES
jgi:hypothetical protein